MLVCTAMGGLARQLVLFSVGNDSMLELLAHQIDTLLISDTARNDCYSTSGATLYVAPYIVEEVQALNYLQWFN